ncbi:MAG: hypothetical protein QOE55_2487, partial [Acidobacteriaceae bacterium]|nr:hypothetical protein [Acidobacteriaceae bacterium]
MIERPTQRILPVESALDRTQEDTSPDGIDRRGFLKCMA